MKKTELLIISNDREQWSKLKKFLGGHGFEVTEAPDPTRAVQSFQNARPDCVLIGPLKPDSSNGLRVARRIRGYDAVIPILFIARKSNENLAIAALKAGITDYFREPFTLKGTP